MEFANRFEVAKMTVKTEFAAKGGEDVDALVVKMSLRSDLVKGLLSCIWIVLDFEAGQKLCSGWWSRYWCSCCQHFPSSLRARSCTPSA